MTTANAAQKTPLGAIRNTGDICPESGVWATMTTPSTTAPIARGDRFPPYRGQAVRWQLKAYA